MFHFQLERKQYLHGFLLLSIISITNHPAASSSLSKDLRALLKKTGLFIFAHRLVSRILKDLKNIQIMVKAHLF